MRPEVPKKFRNSISFCNVLALGRALCIRSECLVEPSPYGDGKAGTTYRLNETVVSFQERDMRSLAQSYYGSASFLEEDPDESMYLDNEPDTTTLTTIPHRVRGLEDLEDKLPNAEEPGKPGLRILNQPNDPRLKFPEPSQANHSEQVAQFDKHGPSRREEAPRRIR